jgi:hypothetical protein
MDDTDPTFRELAPHMVKLICACGYQEYKPWWECFDPHPALEAVEIVCDCQKNRQFQVIDGGGIEEWLTSLNRLSTVRL